MRSFWFSLPLFIFAAFPCLSYADLSAPTTQFCLENFADFKDQYYIFTARKNAKKYGVNLVQRGNLGEFSRESLLYLLPKQELGSLDELRKMGLEKLYARLRQEKPIPIIWELQEEAEAKKNEREPAPADSLRGFGEVGIVKGETLTGGGTVYFRLVKKADGTFVLKRILKDSGFLERALDPRFAVMAVLSLTSLTAIIRLILRRRKA